MRKLDEMKQKLEALKDETRSLNEAGKVEDAAAKMEEVRSMKKQIELQAELEKEEIREVENTLINKSKTTKEMEVRDVFGRALQGKSLTPEERAVVSSNTGSQGGFLVPTEVATDINVLKRQYKSAKEIVGVVTVGTESGGFAQEAVPTNLLVNFDDDNAGLAEQVPAFRNITWEVKNYGAITPIAKSFLQDTTTNFLAYLNGNFARKAIRTENAAIFEALRTGKTAEAVTDLADIKRLINISVDPSLKAISVIATNQDGFNALDQLTDADGKALLQPMATDATRYTILGLEVHVFSNAELPSTGTVAPIFVGSLSEGVKFFDRGVYEVKVSEEAGFTRNQVIARVVERFDVKQADPDAYVYATIDTAPAAPTA